MLTRASGIEGTTYVLCKGVKIVTTAISASGADWEVVIRGRIYKHGLILGRVLRWPINKAISPEWHDAVIRARKSRNSDCVRCMKVNTEKNSISIHNKPLTILDVNVGCRLLESKRILVKNEVVLFSTYSQVRKLSSIYSYFCVCDVAKISLLLSDVYFKNLLFLRSFLVLPALLNWFPKLTFFQAMFPWHSWIVFTSLLCINSYNYI